MKPPSPRPPPVPAERLETLRTTLARVLREAPATAKELSRELGISEKEVAPHLEHLARSAERRKEALRVEPAECLACGFRFAQRQRLTTPGRCPECDSERIEPPSFSLVSTESGPGSG